MGWVSQQKEIFFGDERCIEPDTIQLPDIGYHTQAMQDAFMMYIVQCTCILVCY